MQQIVSKIIVSLILLLDRIWLFLGLRRNATGGLLVVRLDAIGDYIIWLDAAKELRCHYDKGRHHITLLANAAWSDLAREMPYWDCVWSLDRDQFERNLFYRWNLLRKVRKAGFAIAINPTYSREILLGDSIILASQAEQRIGSIGNDSNMREWQKIRSDSWYTRLVEASSENLMELERNAEFMRGFGAKEFQASLPSFPVSFSPPIDFRVNNYYVLFPGASFMAKQWPVKHFVEFIKRLHLATGFEGVICGGANEVALGEALMDASDVPLQNWTGRTTLPQLVGIIASAKLLVGNDTSAVHISAVAGTPTISILGGGHFGRFLPYCLPVKQDEAPLPVCVYHEMDCFGCNWHCIYEPGLETVKPCIEAVTVDDVWRAFEELSPHMNCPENVDGGVRVS